MIVKVKEIGRCGVCDGLVVVESSKGRPIRWLRLSAASFRKLMENNGARGVCEDCGGVAQGLPTFTQISRLAPGGGKDAPATDTGGEAK